MINKDKLRHFLSANMQAGDTAIADVTKYFKPKRLTKASIILFKGDICREFYFVNTGCIRTYYVNTRGVEKTRHIALDGSVGTSLASFISQKPSFEYVDALEDSELHYITHHDFFYLVNRQPSFAAFYTNLMASAYIQQSERIENLVNTNAAERYEKLLADKPFMVGRLSNKILASYLDIAQETLSRLKSK